MRRSHALPGLLVLLIALALTPVFAPAVHAAEPFTDPEGRFTFTYPDGYEQLTQQEIRQMVRAGASLVGISGAATASNAIVIVLRDPVTMANVSVGASPLGGSQTNVDEGAEQLTKAYASIPGFMLDPAGIETLTVAGEDARSYGYSVSLGGIEARGKQIIFIHDGTAYFVTFSALASDFDRFFDEMREVLDTFTFLPQP